ncbi:hypothetical protein QQS21_010916 [Conoideocrella luteorostrata]|uniref:Pinin/SDK/MemA protein domain-containing protein n=1 Tax=Conoideocrella luteorostrata TaxID=1105319 RepID=A0AAJ0CEA4_9HYPO|nr:hypothetical protein QQS21_010916 [Conoideocrella luteorostrata]
MATEEAGSQVLGVSPRREDGENIILDAGLKRKASPAEVGKSDCESKAKRPRQYDDNRSLPQYEPSTSDLSHGRRDSALQEEKKRGKRLFGGLLSTLSQTNTNSQHRRRQEIERRQQERLQKQRDEDDQKRAEKLSRIREVRMVEQIEFQEQVMRHRHSKLLALAEFLKTKAEPAIYYLPWKRTSEQDDIIDEQIRVAKSTIAKEEEDFKALRGRHASRFGSRRQSTSTQREDGKPREGEDVSTKRLEQREQKPASKDNQEQKPVEHHDPHDESGDVLVEADEDMVIY